LTKTRFIFVLGTTAEVIKVKPVIDQLDLGLIQIWSTNQHPNLAIETKWADLSFDKEFGAFQTSKLPTQVSFLLWAFKLLLNLLKNLYKLKLQSDFPLVVAVHGDTTSALVAAVAARINRIPVIHVEAGMRSGKLSSPFPEELNRQVLDRICSHHFASSSEAFAVLTSLGAKNIVYTEGNTALDAARMVKESSPELLRVPKFFGLVSLHRTELLHNKSIFTQTVNEISAAARSYPIIFVCDPRTESRLKDLHLFDNLFDNSNLIYSPKLSFPEFHFLLRRCSFLITDSGGQHDEANLLNIPCLIHRKVSENSINSSNLFLSWWLVGSIVDFCNKVTANSFKSPTITTLNTSPSRIISNYINSWDNDA
jgi:UDP-N-acetylglucosamine 2-epimerase (non-hydrolysing)